MKITQQYGGPHYKALLRKGVYPYEYMDDWSKFKEIQLPPLQEFYSNLNESNISEEDYNHAQKVWDVFECKDLGDYHDVYLKSDVLLLADVFQNFRAMCLKEYKLDPAHYYTSPGMSWDALLKTTKVTLELLTEYDMHLFVEKGMRGGFSMVSQRFQKANHQDLKDHDPDKPSHYLMYFDANNLYGWAMSQPLPTGKFKWVDEEELGELHEQYFEAMEDIKSPNRVGADDTPSFPTGLILEVDLEYPKELHDLHNTYPLAPERLEVQKEWLSPYQKNLMTSKNLLCIDKLVPNLLDKKKYVLHHKNLKLYLELGMKLKKIHRADETVH
ncbi:hypothetical protein QZH41_001222 [Actinostola sp. cb2023]|nr:hypothetical protein QZH41_001222 [Actinostola sp. cb2023]